MDRFSKRTVLHTRRHRCKCGWVGHAKQLAMWVRHDTIIAKICPCCGTRIEPRLIPATQRLTPRPLERVLH